MKRIITLLIIAAILALFLTSQPAPVQTTAMDKTPPPIPTGTKTPPPVPVVVALTPASYLPIVEK